MFAVILARSGGRPPSETAQTNTLIKALSPFSEPDIAGQWADQQALIVQVTHHNTSTSLHERAPEICPDTGKVIASWARLDNRADLCGLLGMQDRRDLTDPQIILAAFRKWGRGCAGKLEGDFSFCIYDPAESEIYCARDAIGTKPFYYIQTDSQIIVASSIAAIRVVEGLKLTPDPKWMALFASGFNFADENTAYEEVHKLRAGCYMVMTRENWAQPRSYFEFQLKAPHANTRDPAQVDRYREAFHRAVDVRARSHFLIGAENSGGLDSASILARLVEVLPHDRNNLHTYTLIGHQREIDLLDELSAMLGLTREHRDVRPEILQMDRTVDRAMAAIGHPPEHGQPLLSAPFFEKGQKLGIRTVFSGFGGDEIVTGYATHLIDELQQKRAWRAVYHELEGSPPRRLAKILRRVIAGPRDPIPALRKQLSTKIASACLSREFLEDTGLQQKIEHWMLPEFGEVTVNNFAALAPGFRHGRTGRLESSALFAASYGIEYRFPLFDRRLIQFFLDIPAIEKRRRSMGRYLHRRAVAGSIPDQIAWQPSKDMGPPLNGEFRFAKNDSLAFGDLPAPLKTVFDRKAFEATQELVANPPDPMDHTVMRARYFIWHVRQLCKWLETY